MRDLSLHLLDVIENSLRAKASAVRVTIETDEPADRMKMVIEDNGPGFRVPPQQATDPFYTTKTGKRTGLGLSLLRAAAERADGSLTIGRSDLGGARVAAEMRLSHIDRSPLGDLAATVASVVCANPRLDLRVNLTAGPEKVAVSPSEAAEQLPEPRRSSLAVAARMLELIREGMRRLWAGAI